MPVAISITTVTSLLLSKLATVRSALAAAERTSFVDLFPRVAHVLEALIAFFRAVMVRDASGEDGDVPQLWVDLLQLRLNLPTTLSATLSTALHHPTTAALGEMEEVAGR